jgi:hypothetical protein
MTPTSLLLHWAELFIQEADPYLALCGAYPQRVEAPDKIIFQPPAQALISRILLQRKTQESARVHFDFAQPLRLDWVALQKKLGILSQLYNAATNAAPLYRVSLKGERSGYLLLETTPEELPGARLQSATIVRFPERELGGAVFTQEAIFQLLSAFQASDFTLQRLFFWFGNPQQEDENGAQLLPYQGINVYHVSCNRDKEDPTRASRIDLYLQNPIEVSRTFFSQKMLTVTGPNESMLSAEAPVYVYQTTGNNAELLFTVEGEWSQDLQRVKSVIIRKVNRWQRPIEKVQGEGGNAPTMRRGAVATQPAIEIGKLPPLESPSSLSPRKATSTEEFSRAELEQTREASKMTIAELFPPRLVAMYKGQRYPLEQEEFIIGRGKSSHLEIPDPDLSRKHATIKKQGERYYIEDHSINGIRYQGMKIKRKEIKPGDSFFLCEHEIQFVLEQAKEA